MVTSSASVGESTLSNLVVTRADFDDGKINKIHDVVQWFWKRAAYIYSRYLLASNSIILLLRRQFSYRSRTNFAPGMASPLSRPESR